VVSDHHLTAAVAVKAASELADRATGAEQRFRGDGAEAADELGLDDFQLSMGKVPTLFDFGIEGRPVHGRTAFDGVQDEDILAAEFRGRDDFVEKLPRSSDKRLALRVLFLTGRFSKEAQAGLGIADSEYGLSAVANQFGTAATGSDFGLKNGECAGAVSRRDRRAVRREVGL